MLDTRYWMLDEEFQFDCLAVILRSDQTVIPADAGIQSFNMVMDSGLGRSDGHRDLL